MQSSLPHRGQMYSSSDAIIGSRSDRIGSSQLMMSQGGHQIGMYRKMQASNKNVNEEWNNIEKDNLKRNLLLYGYGRWSKIRKASREQSGFLANKEDGILKAYSNGFIK